MLDNEKIEFDLKRLGHNEEDVKRVQALNTKVLAERKKKSDYGGFTAQQSYMMQRGGWGTDEIEKMHNDKVKDHAKLKEEGKLKVDKTSIVSNDKVIEPTLQDATLKEIKRRDLALGTKL